MAHGKGDRWQEVNDLPIPVEYKQLLELDGGVPIITRTVRKLIEKGYENTEVVVVAPFTLFSLAGLKRCVRFPIENPGNLLSGIYATKELWEEENVFLLGDVIFSNKMLDTILLEKESPRVFGRYGENKITGKEASELFALRFKKEYSDLIAERIKNHPGKLWDLHAIISSMLNLHIIQVPGDYTDDCDSIQEYMKFFGKLWAAEKEDR